MDSTYREICPPSHLAPFVECFWTGEVLHGHAARVLPDGCADILFTTQPNGMMETEVVGVMTRPHFVPLADGTSLLGVRFHPGMAGACLHFDLQTLTDRQTPIYTVCGSTAKRLVQPVSRRSAVEGKIAAIEDWLTRLPTITRMQRAIGELVGRKGQLSVNDFAAAAGVGPRQLRRTCLKDSGLSPKQLARVLRFRHAVSRLRSGEQDLAALACDCGYYDQSHMVREFHQFAGLSPGRYLRQRNG